MATTIAISDETKEKLKNLGRTGESYDYVINKMYEITRLHLLKTWLYDETDSIPIDKAIAEAKKWQK